MSIQIRPGKSSDVRFLTATWLNCFRDADMVRGVPNRVYFYYHHKIVEELLVRCSEASGVRIVYDDERDPDEILAYIVSEPTDVGLVVHFLYTKSNKSGGRRGEGLARYLLDDTRAMFGLYQLIYTHRTPAFRDRAFRDKVASLGAIYHPYLLFTTLPDGWETGRSESGEG